MEQVGALRKRIREGRRVLAWRMHGRPVPPPYEVKIRTIRQYAKRHSIDTLVETGTFDGMTCYMLKDRFHKIYSIELSPGYYQLAKKRLSKFENISLFYGDSSEVLPRILSGVDSRCLFWLDTHWSHHDTARGKIDCPMKEELLCILEHPVGDHIILIDDAGLCTHENGWPSIKELQDLVGEKRPDLAFEVRDDVIRIHKKAGGGEKGRC